MANINSKQSVERGYDVPCCVKIKKTNKSESGKKDDGELIDANGTYQGLSTLTRSDCSTISDQLKKDFAHSEGDKTIFRKLVRQNAVVEKVKWDPKWGTDCIDWEMIAKIADAHDIAVRVCKICKDSCLPEYLQLGSYEDDSGPEPDDRFLFYCVCNPMDMTYLPLKDNLSLKNANGGTLQAIYNFIGSVRREKIKTYFHESDYEYMGLNWLMQDRPKEKIDWETIYQIMRAHKISNHVCADCIESTSLEYLQFASFGACEDKNYVLYCVCNVMPDMYLPIKMNISLKHITLPLLPTIYNFMFAV